MTMTRRPKLELLDANMVQDIKEQALDILEDLGIFVENADALELLKQHGITPSEDDRVRIPSDMVKKAVDSAPSVIQLFDREGNPSIELGGDNVCFDPGSAALTILDHNSTDVRKPVTEDFVRYAKVVQHLKHIGAQSTCMVCDDVPSEISDAYRLYLCLLFCNKPIITGTFRKESFQTMKDLLVAVRGDEKALRDKPLAVFDACPSPPLRWSDLTCQSVIDAAHIGAPSEIISMPMTGANSPASIYGAVIQHAAETLSGILISQLANKGAPVIWGGSPSAFDLRKGTTPMGAIGTMMIDSAYAQVAKSYSLPTHAYMGLTDAKILDSQAGFEAGIGAVLASLAGINMISGPGMLDFESCFSIEKLIIDNEVCGMASRLVKGITRHEELNTKQLLLDYEESKELLSHPSTRKLYRHEFCFPSDVVDRANRQEWAKSKTTASDRANSRMHKLAEKPSPCPIDETLRARLTKIMSEEAFHWRKALLPPLPET